MSESSGVKKTKRDDPGTKLQDLETKRKEIQALVHSLSRVVEDLLDDCSGFSDRESALVVVGNEVSRLVTEKWLEEEAAKDQTEYTKVDGELYRRHGERAGKVAYHSLFGEVTVARWSYRRQGVKNGETVVPLELRAGIQARSTPALCRFILGTYGDDGSRRMSKWLEYSGRNGPPRATLHRTAEELAELVYVTTPVLEPLIREEETVPENAVAISVGLDRVTAPMEELRGEYEDDLRRRKKRRAEYVRSPPEPIAVHNRMQYIGTIAFVDEDGTVLQKGAYTCLHDEDPKQLVRRLVADIHHGRSLAPNLSLGVVQDGAEELWNLLRSAFQKELGDAPFLETVDFFHVCERLAKLLPSLGFKNWLQTFGIWREKLLTEYGAAKKLVELLQRRLKHMPSGRKKREAKSSIKYFEKRIHLMNYASLAEHGLLVGSGVTEGSCKSIVTQRAKQGGQRWHRRGLRGVLNLRCLQQSGRWDKFYELYMQTHRVEVEAA